MKYIYIILFLFSLGSFSQNIEKIKKSEVIFILHNGTNGNYQSKRISQKHVDKRFSCSYNFYIIDNSDTQDSEVTFNYSHYYDFDEEFKGNPVPYFKVNKSFLRKNKSLIITGDFMNKIGYVEFVKLINNAKTIFLIDKSEIQNKELIVKEVRRFYIGEE